MAATSWTAFQQNEYSTAVQEAARLSTIPSPTDAPHQNSLAAAEVLRSAQVAAEDGGSAPNLDAASKEAFATAAAVLETRRGLILLTTDQTSQAQKSIQQGVKVLAANPYRHVTLLQDVFNSLGVFSSQQKDLNQSLGQLQQAEELYKAWTASVPTDELGSLSLTDSDGPGSADRAAVPPPEVRHLAKDKYAHTLFYLAQVYGMLEEPQKSAEYCAGTLSLQLELGIQDHVEWAENCEQLAHFYVSSGEIGVAEHLLACAEAALSRAPPGASSSVAGGAAQVTADIALASAKLLSKRLALSVQARNSPTFVFSPRLTHLPENVRFGSLDTADAGGLHWDGGLAKTSAEAKDLFNAGIRRLGEALQFFTPDGHVTMHCNVTLEISELYRWLADFEVDRHKKCVLHKTRGKRVGSVLRLLDKAAWGDLYRALQLDVGGAYREITEIKFEDGRPHDKVASAAAAAIPYYEEYVNTFRKDGKLPDSLEGKEEEELYINAVFYLARLVSRLDPAVSAGNYTQTTHLRRAVDLYRYCAKFIKSNNISSQLQLADTCLEMAGLIAENAEMMRVSAARQARQ